MCSVDVSGPRGVDRCPNCLLDSRASPIAKAMKPPNIPTKTRSSKPRPAGATTLSKLSQSPFWTPIDIRICRRDQKGRMTTAFQERFVAVDGCRAIAYGPASRVERARMLLAYRGDPSFFCVRPSPGCAPSDGPAHPSPRQSFRPHLRRDQSLAGDAGGRPFHLHPRADSDQPVSYPQASK